MTSTLRKYDTTTASASVLAAPQPAKIIILPERQPSHHFATKLLIENITSVVVPPTCVIIGFLVLWQVLASQAGSSLPPPTQVYIESRDLILHPFFDNGGIDKGLGFQILASLSRVAIGYALAAVIGVALGTLVGQSQFFMRGFDPIFQILRTVPPLAWLPISLAAFRDGQPSAIFVIFITSVWPVIINTAAGIRNIPQDYRNVARVLKLNPLEYFTKIMVPAAAPYIFTVSIRFEA
jgi:nitrate/nitrite transport system permease protein